MPKVPPDVRAADSQGVGGAKVRRNLARRHVGALPTHARGPGAREAIAPSILVGLMGGILPWILKNFREFPWRSVTSKTVRGRRDGYQPAIGPTWAFLRQRSASGAALASS